MEKDNKKHRGRLVKLIGKWNGRKDAKKLEPICKENPPKRIRHKEEYVQAYKEAFFKELEYQRFLKNGL